MVNGERRGREIRERSFRFAVRVVRVCHELGRQPGVGRSISNQLIRSGTSIGANLEEAEASRSRAEFIATCGIACREARETHYWLRLIAAAQLLPERRLRSLIDEADQMTAILTAIGKSTRPNSEGRTP